tara:strand:+ start:563 stop:1486 length:924 start_codon:yes stop_codon:yes gene_type:complete
MRVALCLSGLVGFKKKFGKGEAIDYKIPYECFKNNIFDEKVNVDVFMHSWSVDYESLLVDCYNPKDYIFEKPIDFEGVISESEYNCLSYHYSKKNVIDLKRKHEKSYSFTYDWVILTRFDIMICKKLDYSAIDNSKFYLVGPRRHHGQRCKCEFCDEDRNNHCVNDLVFFSNSMNMDLFSTAYDYIEEYGLGSNHVITKKHLLNTGLWNVVDYYFTFIHNKYVHIWLLLINLGIVPKGIVKARVFDTNVPLVRWRDISIGYKILDFIIFRLKIDVLYYYCFVYLFGRINPMQYFRLRISSIKHHFFK